jgi:hypothetical protein
MSSSYENTDPLSIAKQAELDLGSEAARKGHDASSSGTGDHAKGASYSSMSES